MQACKYALEVVVRHPMYLIVYVGFLSLMGLFVTGGVYPPASEGYERAEVPFAVIDRDDSELSRSVTAFLAEQGPSVEVADEVRACQDAVATGEVDYLLIVPAGFQEDYLAAAREDGPAPALDVVFSFESMAAMLVDTQVNQYLGLVRAAAILQPEAAPSDLVAQAEAANEHEAAVEEVPVPGAATGSEAFLFYLMWSAYPLTVAVVVSVGILMGAFNRTDVRRRVIVAPTSSVRMGLQKLAAGLVWPWRSGRSSWVSAWRPSDTRRRRCQRGRLPGSSGWSWRSCSYRWPWRFCSGSSVAARTRRTPWGTSRACC